MTFGIASVPGTVRNVTADVKGSQGLTGVSPAIMPAAGTEKTDYTDVKTENINPGARTSIRELVGKMPSENYVIPRIAMPDEILVGENGEMLPESKFPAAIRKYINKLFKGKVLSIGPDHKVYIDRGSAREFSFPAKRFDGELKTAKMTAGANLDSTLEPAVFLLNVNDDGHHPEATGGWDNFYVMFETEKGIFSGIVKTMNTEKGRVFRDIAEIQKESGPSTHGVNEETSPPAKTSTPSDTRISQDEFSVNTEYAQDDRKDATYGLGAAQLVDAGWESAYDGPGEAEGDKSAPPVDRKIGKILWKAWDEEDDDPGEGRGRRRR